MQLQTIQNSIYELRGQKVMLDFDLAKLYEVETKVLNQAVKRNIKRFPPDFMFELTLEEYNSLRSQFVTSNVFGSLRTQIAALEKHSLRTQIATSKGRGGRRYLPYAFTEQGVAMLSGILNSKKAINMNIAIMRAFVFIRQYALTHKDLTEKLKELETKYNKQFKDVYEAINYLINKDKLQTEQSQRKRIGYKP